MTRMTFAFGLAGLLLILVVTPSMSLRCFQDELGLARVKFCDLEVKHCRRIENIINRVTNETKKTIACDGDKDADPVQPICDQHGGDGSHVFPGVGTIYCCSSDLCNAAAISSGQGALLAVSTIFSVVVAVLVSN